MIFKKLKHLLQREFHVEVEDLEETSRLDDFSLDLVDFALALEETFEIEDVPDLSNMDTLEDLMDYLHSVLDV